MNDLQIFKNEQFGELRTVEIDGEPWFVGKDVAAALGYADTFGALKKHVDEDDKQNCQNDSFETPRGMNVINESGVYALVFGSKLPTAKQFKHWVTSEVLPSIRKNGGYIQGQESMTDAELMAQALLVANRTIESRNVRIQQLEAKAALDAPKVLFAEAVATAKTSILVGELAKILKQNGIDIGQNRLFQWLRESGYLIKRRGTDYNMPTQYSMERGWMEVKETSVVHADGHTSINKTPKITGKGQQYFIEKFLSIDGTKREDRNE